VPTSKGHSSPGVGTPTKSNLSQDVRSQLTAQGGSDTAILEQVATSSAYGAPKAARKRAAGNAKMTAKELDSGATGSDDSAGEAMSAAVGAVSSGDTSRLAGLLVALLLISLAAFGAAMVRHKRRSG
jgi:hypothetical protein